MQSLYNVQMALRNCGQSFPYTRALLAEHRHTKSRAAVACECTTLGWLYIRSPQLSYDGGLAVTGGCAENAATITSSSPETLECIVHWLQ